jgi:hypothetical protein
VAGRRPPPDPRTVTWFNLVMAVLYFLIAGLVVYFRLGPVERVLARLVRDGVQVPGWLPATLTLGAGVVAAYLAVQGVRSVRRALAGR